MAAAAIGGALALGGGLLAAREQKKAVNSANAATAMQVREARAFQKRQEALATREHRMGMNAANRGFDEAAKRTSGLGAAARRRVLRREKQAVGAGDAMLANRGLYNSSGAVNMRRGIRSDTDLTLAGIDEAVGQALAGIERDRGRTMMAGHQALGNVYAGFSAQGTNTILAPTHVAADQGGYGQALAGLGHLLGLWSALRLSGDQGASRFGGAQGRQGVF